MKKRKIMAALLSVMIIMAFTGCNSEKASESEETTTVKVTETKADSNEKETEKEDDDDEQFSEEETKVKNSNADFDTEYFKSIDDYDASEKYISDLDDVKEEALKEIAKGYVDDGYYIATAELNAQFYAYTYAIYDGGYDVDNTVAYLYRGVEAWKEDNGTQYCYTYFIVTEDILQDVLGFTKVSEDGDKVTYAPPSTEPYNIYYMDSYVYDRSLGMIVGSSEMFVGGVG